MLGCSPRGPCSIQGCGMPEYYSGQYISLSMGRPGFKSQLWRFMVKRKAYLCGPTVYGTPHLGNLKTFYTSIKHFLLHKQKSDILCMNITDIGDKIYAQCDDSADSILKLTNYYTRQVMNCFRGLGLKPWVLDIHRASFNLKAIRKDIVKIINSKEWKSKVFAEGVRAVKCTDQSYKWNTRFEDPLTESADETSKDFCLWRCHKKYNYLGFSCNAFNEIASNLTWPSYF